MKYSFDTSAFIGGWVRLYPPDVFPAVWDRVDGLIQNNHVKASDEVSRELEEHGNELWAWVKRRRKKLFVPLDRPIQRRATRVLQQFPGLAKSDRTRRDADPFVIALAGEHALTVVTYEQSKPSAPRMPDVCNELKIPCNSLVELFRREGWVF